MIRYRLYSLLIALSLAVASGPSFAQLAGKIAVVNVERAVMNTEAAKKRVDALRERPEIQAAHKRAESLRDRGNTMLEKLRKDEAVMGEEEKRALQQSVALISADLEYENKKLGKLDQDLQQAIVQEMGPRVKEALDALISEGGIGLLLRDLQQVPVVLHSDTTFDLTAKLTARIDKMGSK